MTDDDATILLQRLADGDRDVEPQLASILYEELRSSARHAMRGERHDHTLQTTALMNEAWMRLCSSDGGGGGDYATRQHFLRVASRAMRNILIDHARAKRAAKRGGDVEILPLDEVTAAIEDQDVDLLALGEALEKLAADNERLARVVELRYFGGLTLKETGEALDLSVDQVHYAWELARAWLHRELSRG